MASVERRVLRALDLAVDVFYAGFHLLSRNSYKGVRNSPGLRAHAIQGLLGRNADKGNYQSQQGDMWECEKSVSKSDFRRI